MRKIVYGALAAWGILVFHLPQLWLMAFLLFPRTGSGLWKDAAFNALLFMAWGAVHSALARDFSRRAMARLAGEDLVKLLYVSVAGLSQCGLIYFWRPLAGEAWRAQGVFWWAWTGIFLAIAAGVWISSILLGYMETPGIRGVIRRMRGEEAPPERLSLRGPYAYCRHPVYLFTLLLLWAGPTMNLTRLEFSALGALYVIIGMFLEDRDTARALGKDYEAYRKNVPMLIPRIRPWKPDLNS